MKFLRQVGPIEEPVVLRRELPGGLTILAEPADHVSSLALGVWVKSGSRHEPGEQAGVAHLVEHMVFKGTRRHTAYQIAKRIESLGGQIDAFTTKETTCYHGRVFAGQRAETVRLLGEILCQSSFRREELDKERQVVVEEIHSYDDNPEEYVFDLATEEVWRGHPLGNSILGRTETLRRMGSRQVRGFHHAHYTRPNILVTAAGKLDFDRLCEEVQESFPLATHRAPNGNPKLPRFRPSVRHLEKETAQTSLCLMRRGPSSRDPRRHAEFVLHTILGVGLSSRLFQRIREDEGLAYTVYSFMEHLEDTGLFGVFLGVDPANTTKAFRMVCRELRRVREQGVRKWELESAKAQILTSLFLSYESMFERMSQLASNEMYYGKQVPLRRLVDDVLNVSLDDVRAAAERLLDARKYSLVTLGPAGRKPELADIDF